MNLINKAQWNNSLLNQLRYQLEVIEINDARIARFLCGLIPSHCPFERTVSILGRKVFQIPPLCKLNPFMNK